ncbi:unnamed protein product [Ostreobium quekettii]|uniref:Uncharacterized protein n=1 Tax=Ostreobium quekettii TaxID=121088 RepID=A0A8S1J301_9CHLO|nr:unnamed protein product [Ostreobium quekettii]
MIAGVVLRAMDFSTATFPSSREKHRCEIARKTSAQVVHAFCQKCVASVAQLCSTICGFVWHSKGSFFLSKFPSRELADASPHFWACSNPMCADSDFCFCFSCASKGAMLPRISEVSTGDRPLTPKLRQTRKRPYQLVGHAGKQLLVYCGWKFLIVC